MSIKKSVSNTNSDQILGANNSDIEDLKGATNGMLHIFVVRDAKRWREDGRFLEIGFGPYDWESLFLDVLNCPAIESRAEGESYVEHLERYRKKFQHAIPNYPMLGRIWDIYEDVSYTPGEVKQLHEECLRVKTYTSHPDALRALRKLIFACDEALKVGQGLFLASD
jgi:hypothetical protein